MRSKAKEHQKQTKNQNASEQRRKMEAKLIAYY